MNLSKIFAVTKNHCEFDFAHLLDRDLRVIYYRRYYQSWFKFTYPLLFISKVKVRKRTYWWQVALCSFTTMIYSSAGLAQENIVSGTPIGSIKNGQTVYFEPDHISLPKPSFYEVSWNQYPSTVEKLVSIRYTNFRRTGNEVFYDALLSDKRDGFQEISKFKVVCSPPGNIWPNIKIQYILVALKPTYTEEWRFNRNWPNIPLIWEDEKSNPDISGEQWLFVTLAENACINTQ
jgi:hypothetical protein